MDASDERYLNFLIQNYSNVEIDDIVIQDIKNLYLQAILETVYAYYSPNTYVRTFEFQNSIEVKIQNGELFVYNDYMKTHYHSNVSGEEISAYIPYWIENGHDDGIGIQMAKTNQYHRYEGRKFLERAEELIKNKYPELKITIINDKTNYV